MHWLQVASTVLLGHMLCFIFGLSQLAKLCSCFYSSLSLLSRTLEMVKLKKNFCSCICKFCLTDLYAYRCFLADRQQNPAPATNRKTAITMMHVWLLCKINSACVCITFLLLTGLIDIKINVDKYTCIPQIQLHVHCHKYMYVYCTTNTCTCIM